MGNTFSGNGGMATAGNVTAAPTIPVFGFTGGSGGGSGSGSGVTTGSIASPANGNGMNAGNDQFFADEAYGTGLSNGFGFGVGSGVATTTGGEQAGGSGGASSFGQGALNFELDDIQNATFANSGNTDSSGAASGYIGFNPPALVFGSSFTPAPADTP
jgi:nuclear pore complex protein Nup98-Nup96